MNQINEGYNKNSRMKKWKDIHTRDINLTDSIPYTYKKYLIK